MNGLFGGGNGTQASPYLIEDAQDFIAIENYLGAYYELTKDIDFSGITGFYGIRGNFTGSLDGKGHRISNILINRSIDKVAIFANVTSCIITNIILDNILITSVGNTAILISYVSVGSTIIDNVDIINSVVTSSGANASIYVACTEKSSTVAIRDSDTTNCKIVSNSTDGNVGGYVGKSDKTDSTKVILENCNMEIDIEAVGSNIGGAIGVSSVVNINNVSVIGNISSSYGGLARVGGFAGFLDHFPGAYVYKCRYKGEVYAPNSSNVGGFVGSMHANNSSAKIDLQNCGADATVSGYDAVGGFAGSTSSYAAAGSSTSVGNSISFSFAIGLVTGNDQVGGFGGNLMRTSLQSCYARLGVTGVVSANTAGFIGYGANVNVTSGFSVCSVNTGFGVAGYISRHTYTGFYHDITVGKAQTLSGVTGATTAQMQNQATYAGFDFLNTWSMIDYPQLYALPEYPYYGVTGIVDVDGIPTAGAEVILIGKNRLYNKTVTDANGRYVFSGLIPERNFRVLADYNDGTNTYFSSTYPFIVPVVLI